MTDTLTEQTGEATSGPGDPIDLAHLARSTLGDRGLAREVLALFARQADGLLRRMQTAEPVALAALAHTLKGSARGIGAWGVAAAAERLEEAEEGGPEAVRLALATLAERIAEATQRISRLLLPQP